VIQLDSSWLSTLPCNSTCRRLCSLAGPEGIIIDSELSQQAEVPNLKANFKKTPGNRKRMLSDSDEELEAVFRSIQKKDDYRRYKTPEKKIRRPPRSVKENWKVDSVPQLQTYSRKFDSDSDSEAEEVNPNRLRTTSIMKDTLTGFSKMKNTKPRLPSRVKKVQRAIIHTKFVARSKVAAKRVKFVSKKEEINAKDDLSHKEGEKRQKLSVLELIEISSDEAISEEPAAKHDAKKCERVTKKRKVRIPDNKVPIAIDSSTDDENEGESFRQRVMRRRKYQIHA
jgi:hypothetical protein